MIQKQQSGAILIFSLMMLSLLVLLTQQLVKSVFIGSRFTKTMVERERAEMLALAGITLACAQLAQQQEESPQNQPTTAQSEKKPTSQNTLLKTLLPHLNRWQTFNLKESRDGITGTIKMCITCEQGKININQIFDFEQRAFKQEFTPLIKALEVKGIIKNGELSDKLIEFLDKRKRTLNDISELSTIPELRTARLFYQPPEAPTKGSQYEPNDQLALQDIFTTWTQNATLEPLLLSDALCSILQLRRPLANDSEKLHNEFEKLIETYKPTMSTKWSENLNILEGIYGKLSPTFTDCSGIFSKQFGPSIFSVLSYGKVGHVEQCALAVVRKTKSKRKTPSKPDDQNKQSERYTIARLYWL